MLRRLTDPLGKCQDDELGLGPNSLYYDLTGGIQVPPQDTSTNSGCYTLDQSIYVDVDNIIIIINMQYL